MADEELKKNDKNKQKKNVTLRRKLGDLLVEIGLLPSEKLSEALSIQRQGGKRLGQVLMEMDIISEDEMAFALAMQLKIPFVDLASYQFQEGVVQCIPEEVSRKFLCIPVALKDNILDVAMADPQYD